MSDGSLITEEIKAMTGTESRPFVVEVDKSTIRKFAEAVGDDNPLWNDDEYARKSKYGSLMAPPGMAVAAFMAGFDLRPQVPTFLEKRIDGGCELECYKPIKMGDTITGVVKLVDIMEREGKSGRMLMLIHETTMKNQRGEVVAKVRGTQIWS